jgi:prostamide/prostaglandin F2alpha synthase
MVPLSSFSTVQLQNARDPSQTLQLQDLWSDAPCLLLFLRRLGCPLCRSYVQKVERFRAEFEAKGVRMVALSFEALGEGSDSDRSFEANGFWKGELFTIEKSVYNSLFGRKGLLNGFYGLLDMKKGALQDAKDTPGNFKGDGFQLGGQFIVQRGGKVLLDHRQTAYGDDTPLPKLIFMLEACVK